MTLPPSLIVGLIGVIVALTPFVQASPPDQSWLGGFYDDGDYDDVVLIITSTVGVIEAETTVDTGFVHAVVAFVVQTDEHPLSDPALSSTSSRAPPLAA